MNHRLTNAAVIALHDKHTKDTQRAANELAKLVPPGTRVSWQTWHNGQSHRQFGTLSAHGCWWSNPFYCAVRNDRTGKISRQTIGAKNGVVVLP